MNNNGPKNLLLAVSGAKYQRRNDDAKERAYSIMRNPGDNPSATNNNSNSSNANNIYTEQPPSQQQQQQQRGGLYASSSSSHLDGSIAPIAESKLVEETTSNSNNNNNHNKAIYANHSNNYSNSNNNNANNNASNNASNNAGNNHTTTAAAEEYKYWKHPPITSTASSASNTPIIPGYHHTTIATGNNNNNSNHSNHHEDLVIIHVCDENQQITKDFCCQRTILIQHMRYFQKFLHDNNNNNNNNNNMNNTGAANNNTYDDIDISVHCDVEIFEWLMNYIHESAATSAAASAASQSHSSHSSAAAVKIDKNILVSILISSDFLQMDSLVEICLQQVANNLNDIIRLPIDLSCISEKLINRLALLTPPALLATIRDRKDKILTKLYKRRVELDFSRKGTNATVSASSPVPGGNSTAGAGSTMATTNRTIAASLTCCRYCGEVYLDNHATYLLCRISTPCIDHRGRLASRHASIAGWSLTNYLKTLHSGGMGWDSIYWHVWAACVVLRVEEVMISALEVDRYSLESDGLLIRRSLPRYGEATGPGALDPSAAGTSGPSAGSTIPAAPGTATYLTSMLLDFSLDIDLISAAAAPSPSATGAAASSTASSSGLSAYVKMLVTRTTTADTSMAPPAGNAMIPTASLHPNRPPDLLTGEIFDLLVSQMKYILALPYRPLLQTTRQTMAQQQQQQAQQRQHHGQQPAATSATAVLQPTGAWYDLWKLEEEDMRCYQGIYADLTSDHQLMNSLIAAAASSAVPSSAANNSSSSNVRRGRSPVRVGLGQGIAATATSSSANSNSSSNNSNSNNGRSNAVVGRTLHSKSVEPPKSSSTASKDKEKEKKQLQQQQQQQSDVQDSKVGSDSDVEGGNIAAAGSGIAGSGSGGAGNNKKGIANSTGLRAANGSGSGNGSSLYERRSRSMSNKRTNNASTVTGLPTAGGSTVTGRGGVAGQGGGYLGQAAGIAASSAGSAAAGVAGNGLGGMNYQYYTTSGIHSFLLEQQQQQLENNDYDNANNPNNNSANNNNMNAELNRLVEVLHSLPMDLYHRHRLLTSSSSSSSAATQQHGSKSSSSQHHHRNSNGAAVLGIWMTPNPLLWQPYQFEEMLSIAATTAVDVMNGASGASGHNSADQKRVEWELDLMREFDEKKMDKFNRYLVNQRLYTFDGSHHSHHHGQHGHGHGPVSHTSKAAAATIIQRWQQYLQQQQLQGGIGLGSSSNISSTMASSMAGSGSAGAVAGAGTRQHRSASLTSASLKPLLKNQQQQQQLLWQQQLQYGSLYYRDRGRQAYRAVI